MGLEANRRNAGGENNIMDKRILIKFAIKALNLSHKFICDTIKLTCTTVHTHRPHFFFFGEGRIRCLLQRGDARWTEGISFQRIYWNVSGRLYVIRMRS